mgnify:CR=1 FL=1
MIWPVLVLGVTSVLTTGPFWSKLHAAPGNRWAYQVEGTLYTKDSSNRLISSHGLVNEKAISVLALLATPPPLLMNPGQALRPNAPEVFCNVTDALYVGRVYCVNLSEARFWINFQELLNILLCSREIETSSYLRPTLKLSARPLVWPLLEFRPLWGDYHCNFLEL